MAEFYAEEDYPLNHQRAAEAFAALLAYDGLGQVWFIQLGIQDVGHVIVTLCFSMEYGGFVQRAFRRAGLGAAALEEVRTFCVSRGVRAIHVETGHDNAAALAAYRRVGFVNTERQLLALKLADPTHVG
jgi:GNAT superfamily N-acetyltransferase